MKKGYLIALIVLGALTLLLLALNGMIVAELLWWQQHTVAMLSDTRAVMRDINNATFSYNFEMDREIPISTTVPFSQEITVPINTVIPVNTTIVVPIDLGFTTYDLAVPINTVFPVDMEVTVPVSQTVDVAMTVPVDMDIPVEIAIADTPFVGYMERIDAILADMATQMERPIWRR